MSTTHQPAIELNGLTKSFGSLTAVDHLSFSVARGEIFGLLGPNGAGKTTTIGMLLGLLKPTSGLARVLGNDVATEGQLIRERIGVLLEDDGIYEQLTAFDNLEFFGRVWGIPPGERCARARALLTEMGLSDRARDRAATWSNGMKRRLAIARSLMHEPEVVFLDEPTAGLDVLAANEVRASLAQMAEERGITIFLTTHNMREAELLCDDVAVIREGSLLAWAPPGHLRDTHSATLIVTGKGFTPSLQTALTQLPLVQAVRLTAGDLHIDLTSPTDDVNAIVGELLSGGATVAEISKRSASLEESFVELMEEVQV